MTENNPSPTIDTYLAQPLSLLMRLDWEKLTYLIFILLAIISRFWGLGDRVMSHDESLHTQYSYQYYNGDGYSHTPLMHGPFLFHITSLSYWLLGGPNDFTARVPVAMFGVLLVAIPYFFRDWIGRKGALAASFLFLISPYMLFYSRYIRHDIYVITWAIIICIAIWKYIERERDKYLWMFAAGLALTFSTKEVAFIYVAIFGGFLVLRLLVNLVSASWFGVDVIRRVRFPIFLVAIAAALLLFGVYESSQAADDMEATTATADAGEGFAADPEAEVAVQPETSGMEPYHVAQLAGIFILATGLFLIARELRPELEEFPEFDLTILYTTLVLPLVSPLLVVLSGWDPQDYSHNRCEPPGWELLGQFELFFNRVTEPTCWNAFLTSGNVRSGMWVVFTLLVALAVGLWWNRRRFITAAIIFHAIFLVLYTSVFTNSNGWTTGMVGSLGYWLAQQEVQRGSQPWFYYLLVVPFYEFLPLSLTLLASWHWAKKKRIHQIMGYWVGVLLLSLIVRSFIVWSTNLGVPVASREPLAANIAFALLIVLATLAWLFYIQPRIIADLGLKRSLAGIVPLRELVGFVPFLIWWFLLTYLIYSFAGEKMPWLSTHFVIPMALLAGWFINDRFTGWSLQEALSRDALLFIGLSVVLVVAAGLVIAPLWNGEVALGLTTQDNLQHLGRLLGSLVAFGALFWFWLQARRTTPAATLNRAALATGLIVLSVITIRFSYLATFPHGDYTNEFINYAHGAPATKSVILDRLETLSMRLHGDKSIRVAYDNDSSWPFTWYLRDYPNRQYFGDSPSPAIGEAPVVIVGSLSWSKVEPYLRDDYVESTHTFLWWPMEQYKNFTWTSLFGNPQDDAANRKGLLNSDVREALWDIFWYRDYTKYGETYGGTYTAGQWPLRHDLKMYIRNDVLAESMWDYGLGAVLYEPPVDPYAENELTLEPDLIVGVGQLFRPRNIAVANDGTLYVADSGNHQITVYSQDGEVLNQWGEFGTAPQQFNEPWGIAVDEEFVYVADTWNHRLQKFTRDGDFVQLIGEGGSPSQGEPGGGLFFGPRDILLMPDNQLLVSDTGNHRLQLFDRDGLFLDQIGGVGNQLGQMYEPVGIGRDDQDQVYLADTWNRRIQRFLPGLEPWTQWEVDAWASETIENKPYLATDSMNRVYVTDPESYRVLIFSEDGNYLGRFGAYGSERNQFVLINGIAIDEADNVYIVDAGNGRVAIYPPVFGPAAGVEPPQSEDDADQEEEPVLEESDVEEPAPENVGE